MKVKLLIDKEKYESVYKELTDHGIEVSDDAELVVSEAESKRFLSVKDIKGDRVMIDASDIVFIKSFGSKDSSSIYMRSADEKTVLSV